MAQQVTTWTTYDGKNFASRAEAAAYELRERLSAVVGEHKSKKAKREIVDRLVENFDALAEVVNEYKAARAEEEADEARTAGTLPGGTVTK